MDVALPIRTDLALRTPVELEALVRAIYQAPSGEPETDSLEWKGPWDLSDADDRFETARHILGFGNRTVAAASTAFEGCAYLLAGVEPGVLSGVPQIDPAEIDDQLCKYILHGQPRWTPHYCTVDGKRVLVLVIEAPREGDPIFTLQREYRNARPGRVFIRRHGKTEEAGPADIRALEARGRGSRPKVQLQISPVAEPQPLSALDPMEGDIRRVW